jgi:Tol biopolymer transport system component
MVVRYISRLSLLVVSAAIVCVVAAMTLGQVRGGAVLTFLERPDADYDIFVVDVQTGVVHNFTHHSAQDVSFTWSPDGRELAIVSNRSGRDHLFILDETGRTKTRIETDVAPFAPRWSPTGEIIAFMGNRVSGLSDIFLIPAHGGTARNLTETTTSSEANIAWSPDGQSIATSYLDKENVIILRVDGSERYRLTDNGNLPEWSPDGESIVYRTARGGTPQILMRAVNNETDTLRLSSETMGKVAYYPPTWSPDGSLVLFLTTEGSQQKIRLVSVAAGSEHEFTLPFYSIGTPIWSPDSRMVAFYAQESINDTQTYIHVLDVTTGSLWSLGVTGRLPAWKP